MSFPEHWKQASGREAFSLVTSGSRGWAQHYAAEGAAFVRMGNLDHDTVTLDLKDIQRVAPPAGAEGARTRLQANDILISITAELGMVGLVPATLGEAYINQHIALVRTANLVDPRFAAWYLASSANGKADLLRSTRGATKASLGLDDIRDLQIPIPPKEEQRRIADKLDALLARVDACRERLDRVPGILKHLRQAVLKEAVNGSISEQWRLQNPSSTSAWTEVRVRDAGKVQLGRQRSPQFHSGPNMRPYLRVQNVFEDRIDLSDVMEMDFSPEDFERYQLHVGDILLNEGQSPQYLGRPALYRGELPGACFTNSLIRFQAYEHVLPEFALIVFRHHMHSGRYMREGKITTNLAHLGAGRFAEVEFPLPSLNEQREIVRRVESLFALADAIEARYQVARAQVEKLTPALLAKAFRGELVPQDPNDEPAAAMLERVQAERALGAPARKTGRRTKAVMEERP